MTRSAPTSDEDTARVDDLFWRPDAEPITEDDDFLRQIVASAELPVLLSALAAVLDDPELLPPDLRPPLTPMDTQPHRHGGMSPEQQAKAARVALDGLRRMREEEIRKVEVLSPDAARDILGYLSNGREEWFGMLTHELDLAPDKGGRPSWHYDDLAAGREFTSLIVGAGVAGIAAAHRFAQAGIPFVVIDAGHTVGGTWAKNSYPGVRLDTPTFGYSYSFAQRGDWPNQFARGGEIFEYLCGVADSAGITERVEFGTRLVRLRWNDGAREWEATTVGPDGVTRTRAFSAVVSAVGQLDRPNIPDIPGAERFHGVAMHSQEWLHDVELAGKRVVVIGTGASAYQIVPAISDEVGSLVVFQRSAPWMMPTPNYHDPVTDAFAWLSRKVPHYAQWYRLWVILTGIPGRAHTVTAEDDWAGVPLSVSRKNHELREDLAARIAEQFDGRPDLLAHAIPGYPPGAKRMLRDNGVWAEALRSPRTTLVTSGVDHFTETGVVDGDGVLHEADVVVYATGFKPSDYLEGVEVIGRGGVEIHRFWDGDARAYNGVTVPGFPNFFLVYGPNVGGTVQGSLHFMLERAVEYSIASIREVLARGAAAIDVRPQALDRFVAWVDEGNRRMAWGQPYVRTWYQNSRGRVSQLWPYTNVDYWEITESVSDDDNEYLP
jgi:4-hydroxyacetophenone monooxygenase